MGEIARAFISIRPESVGFRSEANRAIQTALASVKAAIPLTAETGGLREEVRRAASAAAAGVKAQVPVTAEARGLREELKRAAAAAAAGTEARLEVTAESRGLRGEISRMAAAAAAGQDIDVEVHANATGLRGEVGRAARGAGAGQNVKVGVDLDDGKLKSLLSTFIGGITGAAGALGTLVLPPALSQGIAAATSGLVAMAGAAVAVVGPLSQLANLIPALAVGGLAVAAGFGVVKGALSGVGDALKAYDTQQKTAAQSSITAGNAARTAARQHEAAAEAVENATDRLAQAQENQRREAERSAEAIADAQDAVTDAYDRQRESAERSAESIEQANDRLARAKEDVGEVAERVADRVASADRRLEDAERNLADAQQESEAATRRLAQARRDAAEELEDQTLTVERAALSEDRARLNVERARQRQQEVNRDAKSTSLERRDAALDVREAELSLKEVIERRADDEQKLNDLRRKGIEGADGVVEAQDSVTAAHEREAEAQREATEAARDLARAQRDGAKENAAAQAAVIEAQREVAKAHVEAGREAARAADAVADAVQNLARTERDAQRSASDAQKAVADAGRDLERAMRRAAEVAEEAGDSGSASVDKFAEAMNRLSPAAQSMVRTLLGVKDTLRGLRDTAATSLFPGLEAGLRNIGPLLESLHPTIRSIGGVIGTFADKLGALLSGPASLAGFATLGGAAAQILERMGDAALILLPPLGELLVHAAPLAVALADMAVHGAGVFRSFIDAKAASGDLADSFDRTESVLRTLGRIAGNIGGALRGVFSAALPTGNEYLGLLERASGKLRDLIRSDAGQSGLSRFFAESKPLVLELTGLIGDLVRGLGGIGAGLAPQLAPVIHQLRDELVPALLSAVGSIDGDFLSSLIGAATAITKLFAAFAQPTGALKLILDGLAEVAGFVTVLLTDLGPLSVLINNMGTAFAFVGTAIAGIKIARLISDFKGLGAVKAELSGVEAAAGSLSSKVAGLGAVGKALGLAGVFLVVKGTIDDLAPSISKTAQEMLKLPPTADNFEKSIRKLNNPSLWDQILTTGKRAFSAAGLDFYKPLEDGSEKAADRISKNITGAFREAAEASPQWAFEVIKSMQVAGRDTSVFEGIVHELGLSQQFMAAKTAEATKKIEDQRQAARDASSTELDFLDAIDRLSEGLAENKAGFDENTKAGRENIRNREALVVAAERNIEALIRDAEKNGIDAGEVDQLRARLDELKNKYPELASEIDRLANDFNSSLDKIKNKEVILSLITQENFDKAKADSGDITKGFAGGGGVTTYQQAPRKGPSDTIPAWLTPGEYVATRDEVAAAGGPAGIAAAIAAAAHQGAPGFAAGGLVDLKLRLPDIRALIDSGEADLNRLAAAATESAQADLDRAMAERAASGGGGSGTAPSSRIGGATIGSGWQEITRYLDSVGEDYTVTSTTGGNHVEGSYHYQGKAVDLVSDDMMRTFNVLTNVGSSLAELFYDPAGRCVPLDSLCLTRAGWKHWDEIVAGADETIGFNPATGKSEWTPITAVHTYASQEVVELTRRGWSARCTPNHRWYGDKRRYVKGERIREAGFFTTDEAGHEHRFLLSSVADTEECSKLSPDEAAIIGWLVTEGYVRCRWPTGETLRAAIYQSKPAGVDALRELLAAVPHTERRERARREGLVPYTFELEIDYARELLQRSRIGEIGMEQFVLSLGAESRRRFLEAAWMGDGSSLANGMKTFYQKEDAVLEAVRLAIYLEGYRPSAHRMPRGSSKWQHVQMLVFASPRIQNERVQRRSLGRQPVWCVTTALGTWTMRQGDHVMLTGNSIKNGEFVDWTVGGHEDHVHAATFDRGGVLEPGWNRVRNATGAREALAPLEGVDRLLGEMRRLVAVLERPAADVVLQIDSKEVARRAAPAMIQEQNRVRRSKRRGY